MLAQLFLNLLDRPLESGPGGDVMAGGEDGGTADAVDDGAADRVDFADRLDLVAKKFNADGPLLFIRGEDLHRVAAHPEGAAMEIDVVAAVLDFHQLPQQGVAV